jgi:hypothetical protein
MSKVLASHMLQGNFAAEKVTSLELKANLIEPSPFLFQKNACLVEREKNNKIGKCDGFLWSSQDKREDRDLMHWYDDLHD